jgi:serine/threonine-protein kinase RsbT
MAVQKHELFQIRGEEDVVRVRRAVREWSVAAGFRLVEQTKLVTAASEIARNALQYGGGGTLLLESLEENPRRGLRLVFEDEGPGIRDIELALKDGFTTGGGLGLGLGGARRLVHEFAIESTVGAGTRVTLTQWR